MSSIVYRIVAVAVAVVGKAEVADTQARLSLAHEELQEEKESHRQDVETLQRQLADERWVIHHVHDFQFPLLAVSITVSCISRRGCIYDLACHGHETIDLSCLRSRDGAR